MDFEFNDEERIFKSTISEFLMKNLRPLMTKIDREAYIPRDFVREASKLGLWSLPIPEEYGGQNASFVITAIAAEEVARADFSLATAVMFLLENSWGYVLAKYGNEDLKKEVLPKVASGEQFLGIASTEPTGGSDVASIRTSATKSGNYYAIKGQKMYISGVLEAKEWGGGHLTLVKTNPEARHRGISMIYVPINTNGIEISKIENMGRMGISTGIITYNDARVPISNLIGEENKGFYYAMDGFNHARVLVAAACIGAADAILNIGLDYIKNREAFGQKLKDFQSISFEAAELYTKLEMIRNLVYKAAWMLDKFDKEGKYKDEVPVYAAMAKLEAPQIASEIIKSVMMWMGAYGYSKDALVEIGLRGIYSYLVGAEGALNIMKLIISRRILGS